MSTAKAPSIGLRLSGRLLLQAWMEEGLAVPAEFLDLPGGMIMMVMPELAAHDGWSCFSSLEPEVQTASAAAVAELLGRAHAVIDSHGRYVARPGWGGIRSIVVRGGGEGRR